MTYLSEDPTILAGGLLLLAAGFGVALKATQQGKYLIRALVALSLAVAVVVIEWTWVTDNERIEQVVYDLRQAVLNSDVDGVLAHMAPDVRFQKGNTTLEPDTTRDLIRTNLSNITFEFVRVSNLQTNVGEQSRRGSAEFRVIAKGNLHTSLATMNIGTPNSVWSLGFQEAKPGSLAGQPDHTGPAPEWSSGDALGRTQSDQLAGGLSLRREWNALVARAGYSVSGDSEEIGSSSAAGRKPISGSLSSRFLLGQLLRLCLAILVFQNDQLVFVRVVTVLLIVR